MVREDGYVGLEPRSQEAIDLKRHELWRTQYKQRRYLEFLSIDELNERIFDVINNIRVRTEQGRIGLLPMDEGGEVWMVRFTHLIEESVPCADMTIPRL